MKILRSAFRAAGLGAVAMASLMGGTAHAAITVGDQLEVRYLFPTAATVYLTSGAFTFTGDGQTILTQGGISSVIISALSVTFSESPGCGAGCQQSSAAFNGPTLVNLTNGSAFDGWTVLSDGVGITSSILTGDQIGVNWQNSVVQGAATIGAAGVPETATWALMIGGFGLVGAAMRGQRHRITVRHA